MALDSSIYNGMGDLKQAETGGFADAAAKGLNLSNLAMQNRQAQQGLRDQQALRQAYATNVGDDGKINQQGVLSALAKTIPAAMMQAQEHFNKTGKDEAESQKSKVEAAQKTMSFTVPAMHYLAGLPEEQRASEYPAVMSKLASSGVDTSKMPTQYDPDHFRQVYAMTDQIGSQMKDFLDNRKTQAETAKTYSELGDAPIKRNSELFGSRSPNAELTSQYAKEAAPVKSSQLAMKQMLDNYNHPSPQGDASLILNAFKIKFPTAPDVNSLEELSKSQAAPDAFKAAATRALSGGLDQATRDNLMRDGVSTYRANVESLRDIQGKYNARAKFQNVNDPTLTAEPAVENTYKDAMGLQDKIGPYVPPSQRGGVMASLNGLVSKVLGTGPQTANASAQKDKSQANFREVGAKVSGDEVAQYATKHNMKLSDAQKFLKGQGYAIGN